MPSPTPLRSPIIRARGVAKRYELGGPVARTNSIREAVVVAARRRFASAESRELARQARDFWALEDVSFDVQQGEALGIIGRNGAGKSTLLKVLSRITEPSRGRIELRGRIASLLEVGTGFHPELTGRENIYLNGTILGMRKREVDRKFDEIVAFAEIDRFVDTPVKRYSSGMYVRLAFAVAAHLEPEILIVDEVLAVGDAAFQRKCLGKMSDVAHEGRTVLFVSHNMAAMTALCQRGLLLKQGRVDFDGPIDDAVMRYLTQAGPSTEGRAGWSYRRRGEEVSVERVELLVDDIPTGAVKSGDTCTFRVHYVVPDDRPVPQRLSVSLMCFSEGRKLVNLWTNAALGEGLPVARHGVIDCVIPRWPFREGLMRLDIFTSVGHEAGDWIEECLTFNSHDGDFYGSGVITNPDQGILFLDHSWASHASQ